VTILDDNDSIGSESTATIPPEASQRQRFHLKRLASFVTSPSASPFYCKFVVIVSHLFPPPSSFTINVAYIGKVLSFVGKTFFFIFGGTLFYWVGGVVRSVMWFCSGHMCIRVLWCFIVVGVWATPNFSTSTFGDLGILVAVCCWFYSNFLFI